jgi:hypothetical protein
VLLWFRLINEKGIESAKKALDEFNTAWNNLVLIKGI